MHGNKTEGVSKRWLTSLALLPVAAVVALFLSLDPLWRVYDTDRFLTLLNEADPEEWQQGLAGLTALGKQEEAVDLAASWRDSPDVESRRKAVSILASIPSERTYRFLIQLLSVERDRIARRMAEGELLDRLLAVLSAALAERNENPSGTPDSSDLHREQIQAGLALAATGDYEGAGAVFDRIIEQDPECAEAYYQRARILILKGDYDTSLRDSQEALRHDPSHFGALVITGRCYHEQFIKIDLTRRRSFRRMEAYWELAFDAYNRALSILSQHSPALDPQ
ncbi:MAG: tetratricopeptide repeat protein [bacterium]